MSVAQIKTCIHCFEVKPRAAFPMGRSGRKTSTVCWPCTEVAAYAHEAKLARCSRARATTWLDPATGRKVRRCSRCKEVKDLLDNFYRDRRGTDKRQYHCGPCASKQAGAHKRAAKVRNPIAARAKEAAIKRRWRAAHEAEERAARKRHYAKIKADPIAYARKLEDQRMFYRLRREREGHTVTVTPKATMVESGSGGGYRIPAAPLIGFILRRSRARGGDLNAGGGNSALASVLDDLGISDRTFYRWQHESDVVNFDAAERVIVRAGLTWLDLYPPEDYPDIYDSPLLRDAA